MVDKWDTMRGYSMDDEHENAASDTIIQEVASTGRSQGWECQHLSVRSAEQRGRVELRLRSFDIGYGGHGIWERRAGGTTKFYPAVTPPLAPKETARRMAALLPDERCGDGADGPCPLWFVGESRGVPAAVRCDACWHEVPEYRRVYDHDIAALPEAQVAVMKRITEECPDIFGLPEREGPSAQKTRSYVDGHASGVRNASQAKGANAEWLAGYCDGYNAAYVSKIQVGDLVRIAPGVAGAGYVFGVTEMGTSGHGELVLYGPDSYGPVRATDCVKVR